MKTLSLEDIVDKWSLAHTLAALAWFVVLILGITLLARNSRNPYPATNQLKIYAAENATFAYPANWTVNNCVPGHAFIELPGTMKTDFKGKKAYGLGLEGTGDYACIKNSPERLDLYSETISASDNPCAPASSTPGEKLDNGLYLQLGEQDGKVYGVSIHQNACFAPSGAAVLTFSFVDPQPKEGREGAIDTPYVSRKAFLASRQYKDIRALAQSIRY